MRRIDLTGILTVARWEFIHTVKSPTFLILTIVVPLIMLLGGGLSMITQRAVETEPFRLMVIDETGDFLPIVEREVEKSSAPIEVSAAPSSLERSEAEGRLRSGEIDGLIMVDRATLRERNLTIYTRERGEARSSTIAGPLTHSVTVYRLHEMGIDEGAIDSITTPISVRPRAIDGGGGDGWVMEMMLPAIVGMLLIFSSVFSGQMMMFGVIKEKRNRIVEILLSSVSSVELLAGKLVGFGLLGLLQIGLWVTVGIVTANRVFDLSALSTSPADIMIYVLYFVLGYLLLASMFAALGATMKDAEGGGQVQGLVVLVPMIPVFLAGALMTSPNAMWARILSHVPPFIPSTVLLRMAGTDLPTWEIVSTSTMLFLSVIGFAYLSARIFEGGILRFERATSLKEAARMVVQEKR